ncbi:uncharacterized protein LOC131949077 [Physella acuta]|uniref:uncharacterized protein LOC131949077 n=1 Tax=Physella acuta TaxID=109671 RepID=UPI0027DE675E|nr:uncharacterized protein LOC131949077 [Physella acuta]
MRCFPISCLVFLDLVSGKITSQSAVIRPENALVFVGERLEVRCKLLYDVVRTRDLQFNLTCQGNDLTHLISKPMVLDNMTAAASVNISDELGTVNQLVCHSGSSRLASTFLYVERPLHNVTITEAVYNYMDCVVLRWTLGSSYKDERAVSVEVEWLPHDVITDR